MNNKDDDYMNAAIRKYTRIYDNHLIYLLNIVTNLHTFHGLPINPDTGKPVRSSFFEYLLITGGMACIADTKDFGLIVSPCTVVGNYNVYGEPNEIKLTSSAMTYDGFQTKGLDINVVKGKFAFFRNDNLCNSLYPFVLEAAEMLTTCLMGVDSNIGQQKYPAILKGTQNSKLSVLNTIAKIDGYEPYIVLKDDSSFNPDDVKIFNVDLPYVADKIYDSYTDILNNFFLRIGINMLPNAKKERMIVDEVNSNNQAIRSVSDVYLNNRIEGCEVTRALFPHLKDIGVERNTEFITTVEQTNTKDVIHSVTGGGAV